MLLYYLLYNIKIKSKTSKSEPLKKNTKKKEKKNIELFKTLTTHINKNCLKLSNAYLIVF